MKKASLKVLIFSIALFMCAASFNVANAYDEGNTYSGGDLPYPAEGTFPPNAWVDAYGDACDNDYWSDGSYICDAFGFTHSDYNVVGWWLYNLQCDSGAGASMPFLFKLRLNATGQVLAQTSASAIDCVGSPPSGTSNSPTSTWIFSSPYQLDYDTTYALSWETQNAYQTRNAWARGVAGMTAWTELYGSNSPTISIASPANGYTGSDFQYWALTASNLVTSTNYRSVINYQTYGESILYSYQQLSASPYTRPPSGSPVSDTILKNHSLFLPNIGTSTTWKAWAYLVDVAADPTTFVASTSPIYFTITNNSTSTLFGVLNASGTQANFFPEVDCSAYSISLFSSTTMAGIGCVAKKTALDVVAFFVVPSQPVSSFLQQSIDSFEGVFPFSVFFSVRDTLYGNATTSALSAASSSLTWAYPIGGQTINITIGTSTLDTYIGTTNKNLYFSIVRYLLWLLFAYAVYETIVHAFGGKNEKPK